MNKALLTALTIGLLAGLGGAFARANTSHQVSVNIPDLLQIRITDGSSTAEVTGTTVGFDYTTAAGITAYMAALNVGGGSLAPTDASPAFGNVLVFSNHNSDWSVTLGVSVSGTPSATPALPGSRVTVTPSGSTGTGVSTMVSQFNLGMNGTTLATGNKTQGWSGLGFGASDFSLYVDGTESPGTTVFDVTYSIAAP